MCVCNGFIFLFLFLYNPQSASIHIKPQVLCYTVLLPPLLYANAYVTPAICRILLAAPACRRPSPYLYVRAVRKLTGPLASGFIASRGLRPVIALVVPSLPHPSAPVSGGCTTTCPWCHVGEWYWTSLLLVTSEPLRSHKSPNIPTSAYYKSVRLDVAVHLRPQFREFHPWSTPLE